MYQTLPDSVLQLADKLTDESFETISLPAVGSWPESVHRLDKLNVLAIIAAVSAGRPLLVRGEPGIGKSHLARAAAAVLGRHFMSQVIQPGSDYQDLLWTLDYTARLGDAQLLAHSESTKTASDLLPITDYLSPGPLWWAFDWQSAETQNRCHPGYLPEAEVGPRAKEDGIVLLIDEIDKADIALANGLLEVLGNGGFSVPLLGQSIRGEKPPLVVITSNDSRELPQAFVRRCVLLDLKLPDEDKLVNHLIGVGQTHFPNLPLSVVTQAAEFVKSARETTKADSMVITGQAELIDLLRSLDELKQHQVDADLEAYCETLSRFFHK